jgi:hypothetical protein
MPRQKAFAPSRHGECSIEVLEPTPTQTRRILWLLPSALPGYGSPETLRLQAIPDPVHDSAQVLIEGHTAAQRPGWTWVAGSWSGHPWLALPTGRQAAFRIFFEREALSTLVLCICGTEATCSSQ